MEGALIERAYLNAPGAVPSNVLQDLGWRFGLRDPHVPRVNELAFRLPFCGGMIEVKEAGIVRLNLVDLDLPEAILCVLAEATRMHLEGAEVALARIAYGYATRGGAMPHEGSMEFYERGDVYISERV